jgi:SET domain-containing protein
MIKPPTKIYAKKTPKKGMGVFASDKISKGESIVVNYCLDLKDEEYPAPKDKPKLLYDYAFVIPRKKKNPNDKSYRVLALGLGSVFNYSADPNADWKDGEHPWTLEWYALKDIDKDEEISINYGKAYWKNVCRIKNIKE